jgi:hypothetical protein
MGLRAARSREGLEATKGVVAIYRYPEASTASDGAQRSMGEKGEGVR